MGCATLSRVVTRRGAACGHPVQRLVFTMALGGILLPPLCWAHFASTTAFTRAVELSAREQ
eukprot:618935-Alexandrium_andersonii.AAC.1